MPDIPGMHAPRATVDQLASVLIPREDGSVLSKPGCVDYSIGKGEAPIGLVQRNELTGGHWPPQPDEGFQKTFDPWTLPFVNTLILLLSGTTVTWAHHALLHNNRSGLIWGITLTVVLAGPFWSGPMLMAMPAESRASAMVRGVGDKTKPPVAGCYRGRIKEATIGFEPMNEGFADPCLTTWPRRLVENKSGRWDSNPRPSPWQGDVLPLNYTRNSWSFLLTESAESQNRTDDTAIFSRVLYQLSYLGLSSL